MSARRRSSDEAAHGPGDRPERPWSLAAGEELTGCSTGRGASTVVAR